MTYNPNLAKVMFDPQHWQQIKVRGYSGIFIFARSVVSGQILIALAVTRKTKKDHQNRTIIGEMTAISVPEKVLFLWMVVQVESPKSRKTCLNPYLDPPKLANMMCIHNIFFRIGYYFGSYQK